MNEISARFRSKCPECLGTIAVDDLIRQMSGRWVHTCCFDRAKQLMEIVKIAQEAHRESVKMDEIQYSVSYSRGSAMGYALKARIITQGDYSSVKKNPTYRLLWNYVSD